jgi:hypothetical protein
VEFKVRLSGATSKALEQVLRQGFRDGEVRVIRRVQALLEVGAGRPVALVAERLGLDATTVYGCSPPCCSVLCARGARFAGIPS